MKPKSASILNSRFTRPVCVLLAHLTSKRLILMVTGAAAGLFLSGCAPDGVGLTVDSGYYLFYCGFTQRPVLALVRCACTAESPLPPALRLISGGRAGGSIFSRR